MMDRAAPEFPYRLKAHVPGAGGLDPRLSLLLWGVASIAMGLTISYLLMKGNYRMIVLVLLGLLGLASLAPRRGVYILTVFLPFMYFIRRLVLNFQEFSTLDPILLFPAMTTLAMLFGFLVFYGPRLFYYIRRSWLLTVVLVMMMWFGLEMFNPAQGNMLVGVGGAMFFLIPLSWCFFGLLMSREHIESIFKLVLGLGLVTALYGIYQHYFGLSAAEFYELEQKDFLKMFRGTDQVRVMSTFAGLGDFSRYLSVTGFLAFAYFWRSRGRISLLAVLGVSLFAMLWIAVRTSFLLTIFSMMMLVVVAGKSIRQVVTRGLAASVAVVLLYGVLYTFDPESMYDHEFSTNPYVVHTLSGITHPTEEQSFKARITNWSRIVLGSLTQYPLGHGLGSTTPAARKFRGGQQYTADSYFFGLFYGCGILAPVLFVIIAILFFKALLRLNFNQPGVYTFRICFGLMCGFILGCVFGNAARDSITGPLMWLLIGWIVREDVDRSEEEKVGLEAVDLEPAGP